MFPASSGLSWSSWWRWLRSERRRPTKSSWLSRSKHTSAGERIKASRVKLEHDLCLCLHARAFCFRLSWLKVTEHLTERNMPVVQPGTKVSISPVGGVTLSRDVTNTALSAFDQIYPVSNGCYGDPFCSSLFLFLDFMRVALHDSPVNIRLIYLINLY